MKKYYPILFLLGSLVIGSAYAQTITIINHYGNNLRIAKEQGSQYLPDIQNNFVLSRYEQVTSVVEKSQDGSCQSGKDGSPNSYIYVNHGEGYSAFLGVGLSCDDPNKVVVSGLLDNKIAFSWENGDDATVTFCKPENYKNGKCA